MTGLFLARGPRRGEDDDERTGGGTHDAGRRAARRRHRPGPPERRLSRAAAPAPCLTAPPCLTAASPRRPLRSQGSGGATVVAIATTVIPSWRPDGGARLGPPRRPPAAPAPAPAPGPARPGGLYAEVPLPGPGCTQRCLCVQRSGSGGCKRVHLPCLARSCPGTVGQYLRWDTYVTGGAGNCDARRNRSRGALPSGRLWLYPRAPGDR
jgi:hypothetical protein